MKKSKIWMKSLLFFLENVSSLIHNLQKEENFLTFFDSYAKRICLN